MIVVHVSARKLRVSPVNLAGCGEIPFGIEVKSAPLVLVGVVGESGPIFRMEPCRMLGKRRRRIHRTVARKNSPSQETVSVGHYWNQRTGEGFRKCIRCFEEAIQKDPEYVVAYAGLADGYNTLGYYNYLPPTDAFPKAKAAALNALKRDDTLAEAHTALAFSKMFYDWDWKGAESEFRRALELKEDYAIAHYWYGLNLASLGQPYDAIAQVRRAQQLDPLSPVIGTYVAGGYYFARQYDLAIEKCRQTLYTEPNFALARLVIGWAFRQKSMFKEAVAEFKKAMAPSQGSADALAASGHAYGVWGKKGEAARVLRELRKTPRTSYISPGHFAMIHLGLGDKDAAFDWLRKACEERYAWLVFLKVDPIFDSLHSDPRFERLASRIGLA